MLPRSHSKRSRLGRWFEVARNAACFALVLGLCSASAAALDFRKLEREDTDVVEVLASGPIAEGDVAAADAFLSRLPSHKAIVMHLNSPGGLISEALKLGQLFHDRGIRTHVSKSSTSCLSACALAFLGGRDGIVGPPYRVKGETARLGFHAFAARPKKVEFTMTDMHGALANAQKVLLDISDYLVSVKANLDFLEVMLEAPHTSMNFLADDRAKALGIHILDRNGKLHLVP